MAFRSAPFDPLWVAGPLARHVPLVLMPFALLLIVGGVSTPNPTAVGQGPDADAPEPAHGILRVTRHPLMWGIAIWAIAHILANGDLASLVFFGAFAALALGGTLLIDAKRTRLNERGWGVFLQRTSNLPLGAVLQGRQKLVLREITGRQWLVTAALYLLLILVHPLLFGAPALG
jgi:uncharacterized membrane protein